MNAHVCQHQENNKKNKVNPSSKSEFDLYPVQPQPLTVQ